MAEQKLNIHQKLAKIRKQVEVIQKNKDGYGYRYVTDDEILSKISVFMDKYQLSLYPGIVPGTTTVSPYAYVKTKTDKKGTPYDAHASEVLVSADMTWTWINNENPEEYYQVPWSLIGQQEDASQAFGSGLTYSNRYFLLKFFNVATPDADPDDFRTKQKKAAAAEEKMIADEIISEFDALVKAYCAEHGDKTEEVKKFISGYVKNSNYFAIKESAVAAKLLEDFRNTYCKED